RDFHVTGFRRVLFRSVAGRASYAHLFLKLSDNDNSAMFYDINTQINYRINDNNSIHFSGYTGSDIFDLSDNFSSTYGNMMGNLRSEERRVGKECRSRW